MRIYHYHPETFEYYASEPAQPSPANPDEYIIPACATAEVPPEPIENFAIVFNGIKWTYKQDHRGEVWYNFNTKSLETINFIGVLPEYYYAPDSKIANPPEGDYWEYDKKKDEWVGNATAYKLYIQNNFDSYWDSKQNTPFLFEGYSYLPAWRDLYCNIYSTLKDEIKSEYRLEDANGQYITVNKTSMKKIYAKMANVVDEMYIDKQNLEQYFKLENNFKLLQEKFNSWVNKQY